MPIYRADMLFSVGGRPIAAVEAKARPVRGSLEQAVRRQLISYSTQIGTPWALLVDPENTWIFRSQDLAQPIAKLSTTEVLGDAFSTRPSTIGEQVILVALGRVVPELKSRRDFLLRHPELMDFADAVAGAESTFNPDLV